MDPPSSVWEAMDLYFREIPEGEHALDSRRAADKQLQDMAEAIIAGRPQDIRLDSLIQPNDYFQTQRMDTQLNFNRFIDTLRVHNQLEPTPQNPLFKTATDTTHPLREFLRQGAIRTSPATRAEAEAREQLLDEERQEGARAHVHLDRAKAPQPTPQYIFLEAKLSDRYPDPKHPFGAVRGSLDQNGRRVQVYATKGSKMTGEAVVRAAVIDLPHWREIGTAAISMYSYLIVKQGLPHDRATLDIALWHAEQEWEAVLRLHQSRGQGLDESRQEPLTSPDWRSMTIRPPPITNRPFNTFVTWVKNDPNTHKVEVRVKGLKGNAPAGSKFVKTDSSGKITIKDTHARVTGPFFERKGLVNPIPNREGLDAFQKRLDLFLYHLLVRLDYPMKAATIHVAWRAIAYNQYPLEPIQLFADPEYPVVIAYYRTQTSSQKWADPTVPEYTGFYYFELFGERGRVYCSTFANVTPPAMSRPAPAGLGISFSENIAQALEGKSGNTIVDGITVSSHRSLQRCMQFIVSGLYELQGDVKAMRVALYRFTRRITINSRRPSGATRCRSPFIIEGVNSAVCLNQNFSFGNVIDDFPMAPNKRLFTGTYLGRLSEEERVFVLRELNDAFRTFNSFMATLTFVTMLVDSWREVGMEEDDSPMNERLFDYCDDPDLDSSHTCDICGDIVMCDEVARAMQMGITCLQCMGEEEVIQDAKASDQ